MSRRRDAIVLCFGMLLTALALAPGCGEEPVTLPTAGSPLLPESWGGIWEITLTARDCVTQEITDVTTEIDTLCPGADIRTQLDFVQCPSGTFDIRDRDATITCSVSVHEEPCTFGTALRLVARVDPGAGTLAGTARIDITSDPESCGDDVCLSIELAGVRLAPPPPSCRPAQRAVR